MSRTAIDFRADAGVLVSGSFQENRFLVAFSLNLVLDCKKKPWFLLKTVLTPHQILSTWGMVPLYNSARTFFQGQRLSEGIPTPIPTAGTP
jgi:hypothetical protein